MEQKKPSQHLIIPGPTLDPPCHDDPRSCGPKLPKKKRGPMYFIKVALFMIRSSSSDKSTGFSGSNSKSLWRKLVGSVRPLHLQIQQMAESDPKRPVPPTLTDQSPARTEFSQDSLFSPMTGSSQQSASSTPYSSAVGLNEMVQEQETEVVEETDYASDDGDGDKTIDAKAEEFIANFYNEMRLQRRNSINERSLR